MSQPSSGIDRHRLDASFDADEALKSNLIVEAQLLSSQQQPDAFFRNCLTIPTVSS